MGKGATRRAHHLSKTAQQVVSTRRPAAAALRTYGTCCYVVNSTVAVATERLTAIDRQAAH
ncbi:hypothetical protein XI05_36660 [Bradyrhizobium sp. CCBAU 11357]|nr:hypothetical protein [Bradyrhizobium sp. CCBAU 11357]